MTLSIEQQECYESLEEWFYSKRSSKYFSLKGSAGTGKSYLTKLFALSLAGNGKSVILTSTTNASTDLLALGTEGLPCMTVHKFLNLRINTKNDETYLEESSNLESSKYDLVVVDECSMVDDRLYSFIEKNNNKKWLFIGDPCQLNPVKCFRSKTFDSDCCFELDQIMRQSNDNPIRPLIQSIRSNISEHIPELPQLFTTTSEDLKKGYWFYNIKDINDWLSIVTSYFKSAKYSDMTDGRIVTFTNKVEQHFNNLIRNSIYEKSEPYTIDEVILLKSPLIQENTNLLPTNTQLRIVEAVPLTLKPHERFPLLTQGEFNSYFLHVLAGDQHYKMLVVEPCHLSRYSTWMKEAKSVITKSHKRKQPLLWNQYQTFIDEVTSVSYRYASTVRRLQGQTIKNIFPIVKDLLSPSSTDDKLKNVYSAFSRGQEKIIGLV